MTINFEVAAVVSAILWPIILLIIVLVFREQLRVGSCKHRAKDF